MAQNVIKTKGATAESKPGAGGANLAPVPLIGIVKNNIDPTRAGRIWVYIEDNSGTDPENSDSWKPVAFLSPFYGRTQPDSQDTGFGEYKLNPSSYGLWHSPPDIGTKVICLFVNGDMDYGFYIGCIPEPEALTMVPAIGATDNIIPNAGEAQSYGGAVRLPVTNINTNNKNISDKPSYLTEPKPVHSYTAGIMSQQGIIRDPVRGPISSSAQREPASRVGFGVSTPGRPIYKGGYDDTTIAQNLEKGTNPETLQVISRRGGHTFVMDDGDVIGRDNLVRIRTSLGHQILMSDDGQTLMILHSNGQSYIELGKEGTVDVFSTNSINLRTQGDLNLHADRDVNIQAAENINLRAKNVNVQADEHYKQKTGKDYQVATLGKHTIKVGGAYSVESGGDASMYSNALAYVNGSKVNLNTGKTSTTPQDVAELTTFLQTDTLFDKAKGWIAAPAKLTTICSRAPAHAPWANAGQGVDVKTELSASKALPSAPNSAVQNVNAQAATASTNVNPATAPTAAGMPAVGAASKALDTNTTKALVAQNATSAATSAVSAVKSQGAAVVSAAQGAVSGAQNAAQGVVAQIGNQIPQTPQQLEQAGVLKPGSSTTINALISTGTKVANAVTNNMFTGSQNAQNLGQLVSNPTAQAGAAVSVLQKAQTALTSAGAMTGKEVGSQVAGIVNSAASVGASSTLDAVKQASNSITGGLADAQNKLTGAGNKALSAIGAGNKAGQMAEKVMGGLGSLDEGVKALSKVNGLDELKSQTRGVVAGAFDSIKATFEPMKAGEPQNLTKLAEERFAKLQNAAASPEGQAASVTDKLKGGLTKGLNSAISSATNKAASALGGSIPNTLSGAVANAANQIKASATGGAAVQDASGLIKSATGSLSNAASSLTSNLPTSFSDASKLVQGGANKLTNAAQSVAGGLSTSSLASGVSALPGGQGSLAAVTDKATGALNNVKGKLSSIGKTATDAASGALNNIKIDGLDVKAGLNALTKSGLPAGAAAQIQASISAIGQSGNSPIKMPNIGVNTADRSEVEDQIKDVLNDSTIPAPNFKAEVSEEAKQKIGSFDERVNQYLAESDKLFKELDEVSKKVEAKFTEFVAARDSLPKGDPKIEELRKATLELQKQSKPINDKLDKLFADYADVYDAAQKKKYG